MTITNFYIANQTNIEENQAYIVSIVETIVCGIGIILNVTLLALIASIKEILTLPGSKFVVSVGLSSALTLITFITRSVGRVMDMEYASRPPLCVGLVLAGDYFIIVSIFSRVCAATDRFTYIRKALHYHGVMTKPKIICLNFLTWGLALAITIFEGDKNARLAFGGVCMTNYKATVTMELMAIMLVFGLPILLIVVIYVTIFFYAYHQIKIISTLLQAVEILRDESIAETASIHSEDNESKNRFRIPVRVIPPDAKNNARSLASFGFGTSLHINPTSRRTVKIDAKDLNQHLETAYQRRLTILPSSSIRFAKNVRNYATSSTVTKSIVGIFSRNKDSIDSNNSSRNCNQVSGNGVELPLQTKKRSFCGCCFKSSRFDSEATTTTDTTQTAEASRLEDAYVIEPPRDTESSSAVDIIHTTETHANGCHRCLNSQLMTQGGEYVRHRENGETENDDNCAKKVNRSSKPTSCFPQRPPLKDLNEDRYHSQFSTIDKARKSSTHPTANDDGSFSIPTKLPTVSFHHKIKRDMTTVFEDADSEEMSTSYITIDDPSPVASKRCKVCNSGCFANKSFCLKVMKLMFIIGFIITCNVGLWIPFIVIHGNRTILGQIQDDIIIRISSGIGLLTNVLDPIVFGFMNIEFRNIAIRHIKSRIFDSGINSALSWSR